MYRRTHSFLHKIRLSICLFLISEPFAFADSCDGGILLVRKHEKCVDQSPVIIKVSKLGSPGTALVDLKNSQYELKEKVLSIKAGCLLVKVGGRSVRLDTPFGNGVLPSKTISIVQCEPGRGLSINNLAGRPVRFKYREGGWFTPLEAEENQAIRVYGASDFRGFWEELEEDYEWKQARKFVQTVPNVSSVWVVEHQKLFTGLFKNANKQLIELKREIMARLPEPPVPVFTCHGFYYESRSKKSE